MLDDNSHVDRRRFIKYAGAGGIAGLAGCSGSGGGGGGSGGGDGGSGGGDGGSGGNGGGSNGGDDGTTAGDSGGSSDYPSKPVTYMVPFGEGGGTDVLGRRITSLMSKDFGVPFKVENVTGAASLRGTAKLAQAKPDGYYFGGFNPPSTPISAMIHQPDFDITKMEGVATYSESNFIAVVNPDTGIKTGELPKLIEKYRNGEIKTIGGQRKGGIVHVMSLIMRNHDEYNWPWEQYVGYDGSGPIIQAVASGEVPAAFMADKAILGSRDRVNVAGVITQAGTPTLPDVPGGKELGLPDIDYISSMVMSMYAPPGTPKEKRMTLNEGVKRALEKESYKEYTNNQNIPINYGPPEDAKKALMGAMEEIPKRVDLKKVRKAAGVN